MWYHVFPCLLCLSVFQAFCHLVWPPRFSCIFAFFLTCSCMCLCLLFLSSSIIPTIVFVWVHTHLSIWNPESYLGSLLDGKIVICIPTCFFMCLLVWQHALSTEDTFSMCFLVWKHAFFTLRLFICFLRLIACLFAPFVCLFTFMLLTFTCFSACLLALWFVRLLHVHMEHGRNF